MELYWQETKRGLNLVVQGDDGDLVVVGGVRNTKRGVEALANTTGYDPNRAVKGLQSIDEGKSFVEQFEPWRDFFPQSMELQSEVRPIEE